METPIIPPGSNSNNSASFTPIQNQPSDQNPVTTKEVAPVQKDAELNLNPKQQEEARFEKVKSAAKQITFAVSDSRFTIYKDEGQFFTRVTSLRDGKVTVIPERNLFEQAGGANLGSLVTTAI